MSLSQLGRRPEMQRQRRVCVLLRTRTMILRCLLVATPWVLVACSDAQTRSDGGPPGGVSATGATGGFIEARGGVSGTGAGGVGGSGSTSNCNPGPGGTGGTFGPRTCAA